MLAQNEPNDPLIQDLDDDSIRGTGDCLDLKELASLLATASRFSIFQKPISAEKLDYHILQILQGCESKVRKWLATNPNLLEKGSAKDFSGREFTSKNERALKPIQAAIVAGDFAPNENSTGIFELLVEELKHQHPDNWRQILHEQTLEIYTESLEVYVKKQKEKISALEKRHLAGELNDDAVITKAKNCLEAYNTALKNDDLEKIITAHTNPDTSNAPDAQKEHAIEVKQELIDAIANASNDAIQAVLDDPTIDTTLSNLIKAFRKEVDTICQSEIINNPQHLIKLFELYNNFYDRVGNTDPDWKKRELFWCHLVGYEQRYLSASDAQIFANPGLFAIVEQGEINQRSFNFKFGGRSIFPLAFDSHSGLGYKFAGDGRWGRAAGSALGGAWGSGEALQNLCQAKTESFRRHYTATAIPIAAPR